MIETARLLLRPHRLEDHDACHALWSDPATIRFIGGQPATREEAWHRLLRAAGHWHLLGHGLFAVFEKAGGGFVGEVGLGDFRRGLGPDFDPFPEAAWVIGSAAQGQGYAGEAVAAAHDWFDAARPGARTVCIIDPGNAPSLRLAARLGYAPFGEADYKGKTVTMFERHTQGGCA